MKKIIFFLAAACFAVISCTKEKTDYEAELSTAVPEQSEFKETVSINSEGYNIHLETLNGKFYKGYNEIRLKIRSIQTAEAVEASAATFLPILTTAEGNTHSCPHRYDLQYQSKEKYFSGYAVFTDEGDRGDWHLYLQFTINNKTYAIKAAIAVDTQINKNLNMTAFTGNDGREYVIALVSPQQPKVSENELIAGIYRYDPPTKPAGPFPDPSQFSYIEVTGFTLQIDPRMPEPSMGNHSSPNNKNLMQREDGLYQGVVNYTMTGNWTLNFIMLNPSGRVIKGTEVPTDFTPGVEGAKSELHIDILF